MAEETLCIDCKEKVESPSRVAYLVKATGKVIVPLARCQKCRGEYERIRVGDDKGLSVIEKK
jgi:hypothetical protein